MSKWGVVRLADITSTITKGTTPTTLGYNFEKTGINFIKIESISSNGDFLYDKFEHISKLCNEKLKRSQLQEKDILFSIAGAIGRTAFVTDKILPANTNQALAIIRLNDKNILHKYVIYALTSESIYNQFESRKQGVAQLNISLKDVSELKIPLPPLEKQKQIADTLDKVTHTIDTCNAILEKLDLLVKSRFVEMFESNICQTLKWNDVFNTTTGKLDSNAMDENGIYPFFTCAKEVLKINTYAFDEEALLLAGNNAAGKYDVKHYKGKFNAYQRTYVLTLKQEWQYVVFKYQLENKLEYLQQQSLGGLTKYLTLKILGELDFIIPSLNLQNQFAAFVEQTDKSKLAVKQVLEKAETLKKALMQEYFG